MKDLRALFLFVGVLSITFVLSVNTFMMMDIKKDTEELKGVAWYFLQKSLPLEQEKVTFSRAYSGSRHRGVLELRLKNSSRLLSFGWKNYKRHYPALRIKSPSISYSKRDLFSTYAPASGRLKESKARRVYNTSASDAGSYLEGSLSKAAIRRRAWVW